MNASNFLSKITRHDSRTYFKQKINERVNLINDIFKKKTNSTIVVTNFKFRINNKLYLYSDKLQQSSYYI